MATNIRLCRRLGALAGISIGFFLSVVPPEPPIRTMAMGIVVALVATTFLALFLLVLRAYPGGPLFVLVMLISLVTGIFLGPLANALATILAAVLVCGVLGYLLGWLICLLLCRYGRGVKGRGVAYER
jgi:hypothetical protein